VEASCRARRRLSHCNIRFDCFRPGSTADIEEKIWARVTTAFVSVCDLGCL